MQIFLRAHAAAALLLILMLTPARAAEISVAVTSNFAVPMEHLAVLFQHDSGHSVKITSAASSKLYTQIKAGMPFDVLLADDEETPKRLLQEGLAVVDTRLIFATDRLVLWSAQPDLVDSKGAVLNRGNFDKLAIANPLYSAYGIAAKETLGKLTMWNSIQKKLKKSDDVAQAYQMVATENADLGFIALSQLMHEGKMSKGSWWIVPPELHKPVQQSAVLLSAGKERAAAQALLVFLQSAKAKALMRGYGYEMP
jgi:molybdate transport system substrate-binding protein